MKIYKNNAGIILSLDEFLEFLEEEALEDLLEMLDDAADKATDLEGLLGDFDGDIISMTAEDLEELEQIFANMSDEDFIYMGEIDEDTFNAMMGADPELLNELTMSNEDVKVRDIVKAFSYIVDSET